MLKFDALVHMGLKGRQTGKMHPRQIQDGRRRPNWTYLIAISAPRIVPFR